MSEDQEIEDKELFEHHKFVADPGQNALRVDKYITNLLENTTRNKIQQAADAGSIYVNGVQVKSNHKVRGGDEVTILLEYPKREIELVPDDIPLNIVYADDDLVVVNKQAGLVVHPGYGNYRNTLVNGLIYYFKNLPTGNGEDRPGLVHRLDKNTTGIMVVAKKDQAMSNLAEQFFNRTTYRRYMALVWGGFEEEEGTVTGNIGRSLKNRKVMTVFPDGEYGKHAVTHYKVLERFGYVTLIECRLETGRTHQIRAHMQYIGHPLFNDPEYGGDTILKGTTFTKYKQFIQNCFKALPRHALHAKSLGFVHPTTKEEMLFDSELPDDMVKVIEKWKVYSANQKDFQD
jgi:23S rRNA pseudouridine1911/1915/1917 synthase